MNSLSAHSPRESLRPADVPPTWAWMSWGFRRYVRRYVRRHFNGVRVLRESVARVPGDDRGIVCFVNHPSWWDPLAAILLTARYLPGRRFYAPMDAAALAKYPLFNRLGFFGIQPNSVQGAKTLLRTGRTLVEQRREALWITPSGRFQDVREEPEFEPGLGHLAATLKTGWLLPVALEYVFWHERQPELLCAFGEPLNVAEESRRKQVWTARLQQALHGTQRQLKRASLERDYQAFDLLLGGHAGVGGVYDWWRRLSALGKGRKPQLQHHLPETKEPAF